MVKYFAVVDAIANFTTTLALSGNREVVFEPIHDIDIVDVLFVDVVAT